MYQHVRGGSARARTKKWMFVQLTGIPGGMYSFHVEASPDRRHVRVTSVPRFTREARNGLITLILVALWLAATHCSG